ncbi:hypothetical protein ACJ72_02763 [Emergomyces africanus]|uniref:Chromo domain-containing protein n=1 Tax=Emergomyces africanus TaxID=1955775 RepID=A0A1B7P1I0_9EURO|nr:hypothetical protein ACJ72_02763 [Emergomyces africanus]
MNSEAAPSDDDDISITSTACSTPQSEYEVEAIIAQKSFPSGEAYLVKWAGYPLERATWEPEESFCDPNILVEYKSKIASGEQAIDVDVEGLARRIEQIENAKEDRHRRRRAKRIRFGIQVSPSTASSDIDSDSQDSQDGDSDLDGFIVGDNVDVGGDGEEQDGLSLWQNRNLLSSNKTKPGTQMAVFSSQPSGSFSKSQGPGSLVSRSTEFPKKKKRRDATSAARPPASDRPPTGPSKGGPPSSSIKRKHFPGNLPTNSAQGQVRPILKLKTTSQSTCPPSGNAQPPAHSTSTARKSVKKSPPTRPSNKTLSIRARKQKGSNPKLFRNLSSKNRYEKAMRRDLTPDIRQLDLRQPSEWIESQKNKTPVSESPSRLHASHNSESLFVEEDRHLHDPNDQQPRSQNSPTRVPGPLETRSRFELGEAQPVSGPPSLKLPHEGSPNRLISGPTTRSPSFPLHKYNSSRSSDNPPPKGTGNRFRYFQPSEALLVTLKTQHKIDIHFMDVCNLEQYRQLCDRRQNIMFCSGWVIGYDDTSAAVNGMANYLRDNRLAALWYHPNEDISSVIVAFASDCPDWSFLNQTAEYPSARLRIAVRSSLAPVSSLRPLSSKEAPEYGDEHNARTDDSHFFMNPDPEQPVMQRDGNETALSKLLVGANGSMDIVSLFREQFDITYEELSIVNTVKKERTARAFYLYFPPGVEAEFQLVLRFLKHYDMVAFSNRVDGDWEKFAKTATTGTVLFHQKFVQYENMPKLAKLLRASVNVFSISLAQPIKHLDYETHLQRLFPHGGIILMTEDFMLKEPKTSLKVLRWFGSFIERKYPGTWKIFLRPNVQVWLLDLCMSWPDDTLWQMYHTIDSLIPEYPVGHYNTYRREGSPESLDGLTDDEGQHHPFISTREIPDYGSRNEDDHPDIPKGLTQAERDTDHLVEYFTGYALIHADRFRRFVVLTTHKPQPRWQAWTHIEIMHYPEFKRELITPSTHHASRSSSNKDKDKKSSPRSPPNKHLSTSGSRRGGMMMPQKPTT